MQIEGLTKQQVQLLDKIWGTEKESELSAWVDTLPQYLQDEVVVLVEMVIIKSIDSHVNTMDDTYPEVLDMIMKCK